MCGARRCFSSGLSNICESNLSDLGVPVIDLAVFGHLLGLLS